MKMKPVKAKLNLDISIIKEARKSASKIANQMQNFIDSYTTVSVERTVCRILGIDGVNDLVFHYQILLLITSRKVLD